MDVTLHDVAKEGGGHTQEEDGEAEGPLGGSLGKADVVGDLLAEDGPAIDGADAAVDQQRRDGTAEPFVVAQGVGGSFHSSSPFRVPDGRRMKRKKAAHPGFLPRRSASTAILPVVNSTEIRQLYS